MSNTSKLQKKENSKKITEAVTKPEKQFSFIEGTPQEVVDKLNKLRSINNSPFIITSNVIGGKLLLITLN